MNTNEKWFIRSWALLSFAGLAVHKIVHYSEIPYGRGMEMLDNILTAVILPLTVTLIVYKNICIWRQSPRLWWRRCRRFTFWFGISIGTILPIVIGFKKGDMSDIPVILCVAAASLLIAAVAHIRLRRMSCKP